MNLFTAKTGYCALCGEWIQLYGLVGYSIQRHFKLAHPRKAERNATVKIEMRRSLIHWSGYVWIELER